MMTMVIGGSASGKSLLAEKHANAIGKKKLYIATMFPFDDECRRKISKHREMREAKCFDTVEIYKDIRSGSFENSYDTVLLECLSNLLANVMFSGENYPHDIADIIFGDICWLRGKFSHLIIVSNDIFHDCWNYGVQTAEYIKYLGRINRLTAGIADNVAESVCGIPVMHKGELKI